MNRKYNELHTFFYYRPRIKIIEHYTRWTILFDFCFNKLKYFIMISRKKMLFYVMLFLVQLDAAQVLIFWP